MISTTASPSVKFLASLLFGTICASLTYRLSRRMRTLHDQKKHKESNRQELLQVLAERFDEVDEEEREEALILGLIEQPGLIYEAVDPVLGGEKEGREWMAKYMG